MAKRRWGPPGHDDLEDPQEKLVPCPATTTEYEGSRAACCLKRGHSGKHDDGAILWSDPPGESDVDGHARWLTRAEDGRSEWAREHAQMWGLPTTLDAYAEALDIAQANEKAMASPDLRAHYAGLLGLDDPCSCWDDVIDAVKAVGRRQALVEGIALCEARAIQEQLVADGYINRGAHSSASAMSASATSARALAAALRVLLDAS